ncbi:Ras- protein Rab-2A [Actinomortierella wolfii]|nr:Ras- protein Rab-2A [Actinomortierella wolfii]
MVDDVPTYSVTLAMLGDSGVGKSALVNRFIGREPDPMNGTTVGVEYACRTVRVQDMIFRLQILDTCGQERFRSIAPQYYRKAAGVLLVYDVTSRQAFSGLEAWIDKIRDVASANITIMIVGNKKDLEGQRAVSYDEGRALAYRKDVSFIETSATDARSAEDAFMNLSIEICEKIGRGLLRNESHGIALKRVGSVPTSGGNNPLSSHTDFSQKFGFSCCQ